MKIHTAILCDEVRKEDNGKLFFLGVYPIDVLVYGFPTIIDPVLWVQLYMSRKGKVKLDFRVQKDKKNIRFFEASMKVKDHLRPVAIVLPPLPIEIDDDCILSYQVREKNKQWKTIKKFPVKKHPDAD